MMNNDPNMHKAKRFFCFQNIDIMAPAQFA